MRDGWWRPAYASEVDPIKAKVAVVCISLGYSGLVLPMVTIVFPHPGLLIRWNVIWVILAIAAVEAVVMGIDLKQLIGRDFARPIPVGKTLVQVLLAVVAAGLADYAGGGRGLYSIFTILPVLIACVIGNTAFIAAVLAAGEVMVLATMLAGGLPAADLPIPLLVFLATSMCAGGMLLTIRNAHLRVEARFARMFEATGAILRAEGPDEAVEGFLPLVLSLTEAEAVAAFRWAGGGATYLACWPDSLDDDARRDLHAATVAAGAEGFPRCNEIGSESSCSIGAMHTLLWATDGDGETLVVAVRRPRGPWWRQVAYESAVRQLAMELGLLGRHNEFLARLDALGRTDSLTGLANRRELMERLERELARAMRVGTPLTVAMVDMDFFKGYNDTFGHLEGDEVLVEAGRALAERARDTDIVARYGGEEFCLVLPDTDRRGAVRLVDDILARVRSLPARRPVTCSVGVAQWSAGQDADQVLHAADVALYRAKAEGRDRLVVADPASGLVGARFTA